MKTFGISLFSIFGITSGLNTYPNPEGNGSEPHLYHSAAFFQANHFFVNLASEVVL